MSHKNNFSENVFGRLYPNLTNLLKAMCCNLACCDGKTKFKKTIYFKLTLHFF